MPVDRVEYIHGVGINPDRLHPSESQTDIRKELGIPADSFLVLSVGELNNNKNQQVIIRAVAELRDPQIHYLLCGKGNQQDTLEDLAGNLGVSENVHFLGYRTAVVDICSQADVFVMPSKREGLGLAAIEAMYSGLPLITSGVRGLIDIMQDGITGFVVRFDDVNGFAQGIQRLKECPDDKTAMGKENIIVSEPFLLKQTKDEILKLVRSV